MWDSNFPKNVGSNRTIFFLCFQNKKAIQHREPNRGCWCTCVCGRSPASSPHCRWRRRAGTFICLSLEKGIRIVSKSNINVLIRTRAGQVRWLNLWRSLLPSLLIWVRTHMEEGENQHLKVVFSLFLPSSFSFFSLIHFGNLKKKAVKTVWVTA